jgi:choline dehydrogenase-like flavoprotein
VVIIGSGPSGMAVGNALADAGLDCLILEAGPIQRPPPPESGRDYREMIEAVLQLNANQWAYETHGETFEWIRVRAGGGRSWLWGGWAVEPHPRTWADGEAWERPWPLSPERLGHCLRRAEQWLDVHEAAREHHFSDLQERVGFEIRPKRAALHASRRRPLISLDREDACAVPGARRLRLEGHAVATRLLFDGDRCGGVEYVDPRSHRSARVRARAVVLSASPVETTRLLLASDLETRTDAWPLIGKGYMDHLTAASVVIVPRPPPELVRRTPLDRAGFVPRFVNVSASTSKAYRGGFTLELHGPHPTSMLEPHVRTSLGIEDAHSRELSCFFVYGLGEVGPRADRFVDLHPERTDGLSRPVPRIHFHWRDEDRALARDLDQTAAAIADALATDGARAFRVRDTLVLGGDGTAHEAGTCPIGTSATNSVVAPNGQVHDIPGLFVADASLLPTGLDCPPTLTIVALALNTADGILAKFGSNEL